MVYTRDNIALFITERLEQEKANLQGQYLKSKDRIGYFYLDNLLPNELAKKIYSSFPLPEASIKRKSLREHKYVAYQMDEYEDLLEETIYAFQNEQVVALVSEICNIIMLYPDSSLYAGGISIMQKENFLKPHLDNSHDGERRRWRVLNLLYYVSPEWREEYGGNLELWVQKEEPITIVSKFNRLVVMSTHGNSWHSVNKVVVDKSRACVSNYYFSDRPLLVEDSFHVTSFRGRPKENILDSFLRIDTKLRSFVRKVFKNGIKENPHKYKK